jgi:hypothetical protein
LAVRRRAAWQNAFEMTGVRKALRIKRLSERTAYDL